MNFIEKVKRELPELNIVSDELMSKHTTFKVAHIREERYQLLVVPSKLCPGGLLPYIQRSHIPQILLQR